MKQFITYTLATLLGLFLFFFVGIFMFFGMVGAVATLGTDTQTALKPNSVYVMELNGVLEERSSEDEVFFQMLSKALDKSAISTIGLNDLLANIERAANEPSIKGIYLKGGTLTASYASITELRNALLRFKESGKWIVAYADTYLQSNYYLASVADNLMMNPEGMLSWSGLYSQTTFYKDLLDKLGVEMQIVKVGTFKSAVEPYIMTELSEPNRMQIKGMITDIWANIVNDVANSRNVSIDSLQRYADKSMAYYDAQEYINAGLVDTLLYEQDVNAVLKTYNGLEDVEFVSHTAMKTLPKNTSNIQSQKVAVIYAVGSITDESGDGIVGKDMVKTINKVREDKSIKSVVLRVNSPGGSAFASEQIWYALSKLKEEKPLIVSMGDYAASGGYYISCMADTIVAQPTTLTGSIGIFGMIPNSSRLMDKIGLDFDGVGTNLNSDMESRLLRGMDKEARAMMQAHVDRGYELFVKRCADGRGVTTDEIKKIAEGRVWSGEAAVENGLVDILGGLNDALAIAAEKANLSDYRVVEYPKQKDAITLLLEELSGEMSHIRFKNSDKTLHYLLNRWNELQSKSYSLEAIMPMEMDVK